MKLRPERPVTLIGAHGLRNTFDDHPDELGEREWLLLGRGGVFAHSGNASVPGGLQRSG